MVLLLALLEMNVHTDVSFCLSVFVLMYLMCNFKREGSICYVRVRKENAQMVRKQIKLYKICCLHFTINM